MKHSGLFLCLISLILFIFMVVPVNAELSTISSISPAVGYTGTTATVTIVGTNFNETLVKPKLLMTGKNNITAYSITSLTSTTIVCRFDIPSDTTLLGTWGVVVVNQDGSETSPRPDSFTIRSPMTITSITPVSARTNNVTKISVVGTGLSGVNSILLFNKDYTNISASGITAISSTMVNGTLTLTSANIDTYQVCVKDSFDTVVCGLTFKITSDAVGSIDISSSPSDASLYLDGALKGTTPITVNDLAVGSYKLILKKDGYSDWARTAKVTNGGTTSFDAVLEAKTVATTAPTPVPTTAPTTVKTTRKSTITTPTPWPSDTPTPASPVGTLAVIGAVGLAFIVLRRR